MTAKPPRKHRNRPVTRVCVECGKKWESVEGFCVDNCPQCRAAAVAPTVELLAQIRELDPLEAYVRGILSEKIKAHDQLMIREIGGLLDAMRARA